MGCHTFAGHRHGQRMNACRHALQHHFRRRRCVPSRLLLMSSDSDPDFESMTDDQVLRWMLDMGVDNLQRLHDLMCRLFPAQPKHARLCLRTPRPFRLCRFCQVIWHVGPAGRVLDAWVALLQDRRERVMHVAVVLVEVASDLLLHRQSLCLRHRSSWSTRRQAQARQLGLPRQQRLCRHHFVEVETRRL